MTDWEDPSLSCYGKVTHLEMSKICEAVRLLDEANDDENICFEGLLLVWDSGGMKLGVVRCESDVALFDGTREGYEMWVNSRKETNG